MPPVTFFAKKNFLLAVLAVQFTDQYLLYVLVEWMDGNAKTESTMSS